MTGDGIPMAATATVVDVIVPDGGVNADAASTANVVEYDVVNTGRDTWDLQFSFPTAIPEAGGETDGNFIYTAGWNTSDFYKYDLDGNLLETFTIAGVSSIRDMAYDGQYFYGGAAATTI